MKTTPEKNTQQILLAVEEIAKGRLQLRSDVERLIDLAIRNKKVSLLEELSFHAKFSIGLLRVIQKKESVVDEQYFLKAEEEYKESIRHIKDLLHQLMNDENDFIKSIYSEKFFQLTQQSLSNLNMLCSDLGYLKLYFNDLKNFRETL